MKHAHEDFSSDNVDWKETMEEIHSIAKEKGFWDKMDNIIGIMEMERSPFTEDQILQVKKAFITQKIMLIVTELSEGVESDRKSITADWDSYAEDYKSHMRSNINQEKCMTWAFEAWIKDSFEDEIADAVIRIFDLCQKMGIDIIKHIRYKMEYNKTRDKLHNKEY